MRQSTLRFQPYPPGNESGGTAKLTYTTSSGPLSSTSGKTTTSKYFKSSQKDSSSTAAPRKDNSKETTSKSANSKSWADRRAHLKSIADGTLEAIERGSYDLNGTVHSIQPHLKNSLQGTKFYGAESDLARWHARWSGIASRRTVISVLEVSTLEAAWSLSSSASTSASSSLSTPPRRVGILNFASATKPGGGFINGAQAQEESIARSSAIYPSLKSPIAQSFYRIHSSPKSKKRLRPGFYTDSMVWSPEVAVFRDDDGGWLDGGGYTVDVVTSAAVNAGVVRQNSQIDHDGEGDEVDIEWAMRERMARVLFLFEIQGVDTIVLGSFGTGVFRNRVNMVARIWKELLWKGTGRFRNSFGKVVFAVLGKETFEEFGRVFREK
ncbi:uncharacterized protein STEHIDRAFT_104844 [Stereum hirsutum FP-91666 SS1]|uniref:uncharacterized protein n=1 Tax=Stereum hirsutum (strain FP-91666) TaxID=721885 RepID=UPI00044492BD|nr:uncharacterized protein STEHIDRAFT_104844 [Stereum hirsutum FP-91666 SS1]EIM80559.1 hypothetical protein STEHIDRAFT_104844 [Stereum hirsutum FP-91666 SS1]